MATSPIPASHLDLLERPLFAHLATIRPDGTPQVNPMWFFWDGERVRFTNSTKRQKFRNVSANPEVALSINDPERPYRYLEIRGQVTEIAPDPDAAFFLRLAERYALPMDGLPGDAEFRVVYAIEPHSVSFQ